MNGLSRANISRPAAREIVALTCDNGGVTKDGHGGRCANNAHEPVASTELNGVQAVAPIFAQTAPNGGVS